MIVPRRSRRGRRPTATAIALYVNAGLLLAILLALLGRDGAPNVSILPSARAADGPAMAGGGNIYVVPGQFSLNTFGIYLLDTDSQTLCAYKFDGQATNLRLIAARNYRHDRRLARYNTSPDPSEIEHLVELERNPARRAGTRRGVEGDPPVPGTGGRGGADEADKKLDGTDR